MSLLVVGSIALDSVETPFGSSTDAIGGSAVFCSHAASLLHPVQMVGVIGDDYPFEALERLAERGVDLAGVARKEGESFRWKGKYSSDLHNRETLETRLGVFADFQPSLPDSFRDTGYVFLGNIDPELQLSVLDQVRNPTLVACDTMNYWISSKRNALLEVLTRIDVLMVNDAEARELSGEWNVYRAAKWVLKQGPTLVVIKQGEYGAVLINSERVFYIPAYPLEEVFDPTGAGDAFAGGLVALLARDGPSPKSMDEALRQAVAMGSFAVESFSIDRLLELTPEGVASRAREARIKMRKHRPAR